MLIAVASPFRTGSTRLFNILRIIIEQNYPENEINYLWLNNNPLAKINLTKLHDDYKWKNFKIDTIFTTKRDIRYTMSSCLEYFSILDPDTKKDLEWFDTICNQVIRQYNDWKDRSLLEVIYEKWDQEKYYYVCKMAEILNMHIDPVAVFERFDKFYDEVEFDGNMPVDKRYLGSKFHISKSTNLDWEERLPKKFVKHLKKNFSEYFYA